MKKIFIIMLLYCVIILLFSQYSFTQINESDGLNMPGGWNSWANPSSGVFRPSLISSGARRYHSIIKVAATGGDCVGGKYTFLFTSPAFGNPWGNKWAGTAVSINTIQSYTYNTGVDDTISVVNDKWYTVNWQDQGYTGTNAIFMETSGEPVTIDSVTYSPTTVTQTDIVQIRAKINHVKSSEEKLYLRYTTNSWVSSSIQEFTMDSDTVGFTSVGPYSVGTTVQYYVFSTTVSSPSSDYDMYTINFNNNGGSNYSFSVIGSSYTIEASAGSNGNILPSGSVPVTHGNDQQFSITPDFGYVVDSVIVDASMTDSTTSYTFYNVTANHTIRAVFVRKINVTFSLNMKLMMRNGDFIPDSGDVVAVRGNFNNWKNKNLLATMPDTLRDYDNDSIYTKTVAINENQTFGYKFWKTLRNGLEWEKDPNRTLVLGINDTTLPVVYYNNANVNTTFGVNMKVQFNKGNFKPDSGDVVNLAGSFNNWNPATQLFDLDNDSVYTKTVALEGDLTHNFKFWKTLRGGLDWEWDPNRSVNLGFNDTTLAVEYFNREYPPVNITFQLDMRIKMQEKLFLPEEGDVVTVRGSFNNWGDPPTGNIDTLKDLDGDSVYTKMILIPGYQTIGYKFWKTPRGGIDFETIPNRGFNVQLVDDIIPTVYFDDDAIVDMGTFMVAQGWNMVSVPVYAADYKKTNLFPTATTNAFGYESGYVSKDTLKNMVGYWLKFNAEEPINIIGASITKDSVTLAPGWNMIGSITTPIATSVLLQDPVGVLGSSFYGYASGYQIADTLRPGKGYWIKANSPGKLIFDVSGFKK
jgi:hypothetical protein